MGRLEDHIVGGELPPCERSSWWPVAGLLLLVAMFVLPFLAIFVVLQRWATPLQLDPGQVIAMSFAGMILFLMNLGLAGYIWTEWKTTRWGPRLILIFMLLFTLFGAFMVVTWVLVPSTRACPPKGCGAGAFDWTAPGMNSLTA